MGEDVQSLYVEELGITMSRHDLFDCLVHEPMMGAIEVDWRDFFPYLKWIPNKKFENRIQQMYIRRHAVMKSLIQRRLEKKNASEQVATLSQASQRIISSLCMNYNLTGFPNRLLSVISITCKPKQRI